MFKTIVILILIFLMKKCLPAKNYILEYQICETTVRILSEHNFEQFSCIQKHKILWWNLWLVRNTAVQLALLSLSWEAVQWPLALTGGINVTFVQQTSYLWGCKFSRTWRIWHCSPYTSSRLDYGNALLLGANISHLNRLHRLQNSAAKLIFCASKHDKCNSLSQ